MCVRKRAKWCLALQVGTGYSFVELMELRERLKPHYKVGVLDWCSCPHILFHTLAVVMHSQTYDIANRPPHFAEWRPGKRDDVPDIWIEVHVRVYGTLCILIFVACILCVRWRVQPQHSYIMELKAGELVTSDQFNANMCLRFPRVVGPNAWLHGSTGTTHHARNAAGTHALRQALALLLDHARPRRTADQVSAFRTRECVSLRRRLGMAVGCTKRAHDTSASKSLRGSPLAPHL